MPSALAARFRRGISPRTLLFALTLVPLIGLGSSAIAGELSNLTVLVDSVEGLPGSTVRAEVAIDNTGTPIDAWSYGVCHDSAIASPVALTFGPDLAPPAFFDQQIHALGVTQVVITDFVLANPLPLGRHVLMQIDYQLLGSIGSSTALTLCDTLPGNGSPPIQLSFTSGSTALPFIGQAGQLSVVECMSIEDLLCRSTPAGNVQLSWTPRPEHSAIEVLRNGAVIATLPGDSGDFVDVPAIGRHEYQLSGTCGGGTTSSQICVGHAIEFSLDSVSVTEGEVFAVPVRLDFRGGFLDGFSFGVEHDPARLTPLSALHAGALSLVRAGQGPDVLIVQMVPVGLTVGMVVASEEPFESLLPFQGGTDLVMELTYQAAPGAAITPLVFTGALGNPPVATEAVLELQTVVPRTVAGEVEILEVVGDSPFLRGDVNGNGTRELTDIIQLLFILFSQEDEVVIACEDVLDANDDGQMSITDAVAELEYLFGGGAPLPPPLEACGQDPTVDSLDCLVSPCVAS